MSSKFETLNDVTCIIHVGAHRGEEVEQYADMGAKTVIWVEPNPDVFKEMKHFSQRSLKELTTLKIFGSDGHTTPDYWV